MQQQSSEEKWKELTITKERLEGSLPPPTKAPFLVLERLDNLQVLCFQGHDRAATKNHYFESRRASSLVAFLGSLQHTMLMEGLQTVAEHLPADDAFPLWVGYGRLRAGGLLESCVRTVQRDLADEGVE